MIKSRPRSTIHPTMATSVLPAFRCVALAILAIVLSACNTDPRIGAESVAVDRAAERETLMALERKWSDMYAQGDVDGIAELLSVESIFSRARAQSSRRARRRGGADQRAHGRRGSRRRVGLVGAAKRIDIGVRGYGLRLRSGYIDAGRRLRHRRLVSGGMDQREWRVESGGRYFQLNMFAWNTRLSNSADTAITGDTGCDANDTKLGAPG